jgi:hemolysin III
MFILYVISCIYHALGRNVSGKKVLRVIDHINVMLMVAGTYMPICLSLLDAKLGWWVFGIVWFITIIAVVFNAIDVDKYTVISVICNLLLGWGVLLLIKPLLNVCSMNGIILLILGGVMYTVGSILYGIGSKIPYMHSVFHFFVLFGSIFHFIFIYGYCI